MNQAHHLKLSCLNKVGIDLGIEREIFCGKWQPRCPIREDKRSKICNSNSCPMDIFKKVIHSYNIDTHESKLIFEDGHDLEAVSIKEPIAGFNSCKTMYINAMRKDKDIIKSALIEVNF